MERVYHRYEYWECFKSGFFKNISGDEKKSMSNEVVEFFKDSKKTEKFMRKVISDWPFSTEHNLTNISLNRVAWLGQASCCLYNKIPYRITMETWRLVPKDKQELACQIAENVIKEFEKQQQKSQLCLKFI